METLAMTLLQFSKSHMYMRPVFVKMRQKLLCERLRDDTTSSTIIGGNGLAPD